MRDVFGFVKGDYLIKPKYEPTYCNYLTKSRDFKQLNKSAINIAEDYMQKWVIPLQIKLDGGNLIANENSAFIAEKCLSDNNKYPEKEISAIIYEVGAVRVFIPLNLGDVVGHSDGYLSFLQEDTICVCKNGVI